MTVLRMVYLLGGPAHGKRFPYNHNLTISVPVAPSRAHKAFTDYTPMPSADRPLVAIYRRQEEYTAINGVSDPVAVFVRYEGETEEDVAARVAWSSIPAPGPPKVGGYYIHDKRRRP